MKQLILWLKIIFFIGNMGRSAEMSNKNATVYVVDDDPSMRRSLQRLIGLSGYDVFVYESANSFLSQAEIHHNCCLVLDVLLPGIDGIALQELLAKKKGISIPIIFISGCEDTSHRNRAMKNGAVDFLYKPFYGKDLIDAIEIALLENKKNNRNK